MRSTDFTGIALGLTYPLISLILTARGYGETIIGLNAGVYALGMVTATLMMPRMTNRLSAGRPRRRSRRPSSLSSC